MPISNRVKPENIIPTGITNHLKFIRNEKEPNKVNIEWRDSELLALYASIQLYEYEKNPTFQHGSPHDNFLGVIGELSVREILQRIGIIHEYVPRKLNYWGTETGRKTDQRPFDFKLDDGKTLEIVTLKPNRYFAEIKDTAWKRSNYAIVVKINWLKCYVEIFYDGKYQNYEMNAQQEIPQPIDSFKDKPIVNKNQIIGEAEIIGYDALEHIQEAPETPMNETIIEPNSGWFYSALNQKMKSIDDKFNDSITPIGAARCIRIKPNSQLPNIKNLWKQIKPNVS
jgi:hypothetical protein